MKKEFPVKSSVYCFIYHLRDNKFRSSPNFHCSTQFRMGFVLSWGRKFTTFLAYLQLRVRKRCCILYTYVKPASFSAVVIRSLTLYSNMCKNLSKLFWHCDRKMRSELSLLVHSSVSSWIIQLQGNGVHLQGRQMFRSASKD